MGRSPKKAAPVVPDKPITAKVVHNLLRTSVLKDDRQLPKPKSMAVVHLAKCSEILRHQAQQFKGPLLEEREQAKVIWAALGVLAEQLPKLHDQYYFMVKDKEGLMAKELFNKFKADLDALDALIIAVRNFHERGFPNKSLSLSFATAIGGPIEKWKDFVRELADDFNQVLSYESREASYRFVESMTPLITGEEPTLGAVRTEILHKRKKKPKVL